MLGLYSNKLKSFKKEQIIRNIRNSFDSQEGDWGLTPTTRALKPEQVKVKKRNQITSSQSILPTPAHQYRTLEKETRNVHDYSEL